MARQLRGILPKGVFMVAPFNRLEAGGRHLGLVDSKASLRFLTVCLSTLGCRILHAHHLQNAELGINFSHIRAKSMTVLNPLQRVDERIMDDADLAGPIIFFFCFGISLLFVSIP